MNCLVLPPGTDLAQAVRGMHVHNANRTRRELPVCLAEWLITKHGARKATSDELEVVNEDIP